MDGSSDGRDADAPHGLLSQDTPTTALERPGPPNLTTDLQPQTASHQPSAAPTNLGSVSASPAANPGSTGAGSSSLRRDRGYSLRRSLIARRFQNRPASKQAGLPIELLEGSSTGLSGTRKREEAKQAGRRPQSPVAVSPAGSHQIGNDILSATYASNASRYTETDSRPSKSTFTNLNLPNYDSWARKRIPENQTLQKAKIWKDKIIAVLLQQTPIPPSKDGRHIELDAARTRPLLDERTGKEYMDNSIRSSRYTVWNFLPKQLFFQFSKLANAYFLVISILQLIPGLSTTGNYTTIAPLMVFVAISMGKEGYDDLRRYKLDKIENNRETLVLQSFRPAQESDSRVLGDKLKSLVPSKVRMRVFPSPTSSGEQEDRPWRTLKWHAINVGDIIKLHRDDHIPADVVLLSASGPNGVAYIETMALDGETNLKSKQAPTSLAQRCTSEDAIAACHAHIVVEDPNLDLYNFDGRVTVDGETLPLTTNEVIFRGSTLRNTAQAVGIVVNTGEECKIRMNANKNPRTKAPAIQVMTNKIVIMLVIFVVVLALFCTTAYQVWTNRTEEKAWYLKGLHVNFTQISIGFVILYNTLIPLSLYVSLEIIKIGQVLLMADVEMYDPASNTPMTANTTTILENLGQVNYIFSDKTGTLTDNIMKFRKLSVAGYAWLHDLDLQEEEAAKLEDAQEAAAESRKKKKDRGTTQHLPQSKLPTRPANERKVSALTNSTVYPAGALRNASAANLWKSSARPSKAQPEMRTADMLRFMQHKPHSVFTKKAKFFLLSLALCHTCLPEVKENGDIEFQAASPDELALVKAAQELGYLVIDRPSQSITLTYPGSPDSAEPVTESYEILDVIEFSSKRKRMSIIVRFPSGRICIFCKGADSMIMPRLKLAPMAMQKKSEVSKRSNHRKSLEAEEALRRLSESSPRASFNRTSLSLPRPSMNASRPGLGPSRPSIASSRLRPLYDELDTWLRRRESDVESVLDNPGAYTSARNSFASMERRPSATSATENALDDMIDEGLVLDDSMVFERCFQHIDDFASEGLRTLLFGYRFLEEVEYQSWKKVYLDATTSLADRQNLIENAGELIEQHFHLSGATAIEDKLQKGVPETIDKLRRANIKIWMLTGDKRETAINIGHSARICRNYSKVVILDHTTGELERRMASTLLEISSGSIAHSVIVVDGQTLAEIDANESLAFLFFDLVVLADSVICCRASPSQKASLVKKIRTKVPKSLTLAIGDGANDIAMITDAHVGIGISGKEGLQAARIADYSIAQFRFLQRLLLVHGHWNYVRTAKYILATFWKELLFYVVQAFYQKWNGYTGTSLYESTSLTVFNTLFTSLAVIFLGIFEQDLNASTLLAVPELYTSGQTGEAFNFKVYLGWMFMAASESFIIYFLMYGLFGKAVFTKDQGLLAMGTLAFSGAVIFINTKLLFIEMHNQTFIPALGWVLSVGTWFCWTLLLAVVFEPNKSYLLYPIKDGFLRSYGRDMLWWLVLILTQVALTLLELGVSSVRKSFWPTDVELFQELQNDPVIRKRFEEAVRGDEDRHVEAGGVGMEVEIGEGEGKNNLEEQARREGEIRELLSRPRVMRGHAEEGGDAKSVNSAVNSNEGGSSRQKRLTRRKLSLDLNCADGSAILNGEGKRKSDE
ncbi:unnamed protein product [Diplocarpon coronariae]